MWVQLRREVSRETFHDATVLFLFEGGAEHLSVLREVCSFVLGTSGLVFASDYRDFFPYKLSRGGGSEMPNARCMASSQGYVSAQMLLIACDGLHLV